MCMRDISALWMPDGIQIKLQLPGKTRLITAILAAANSHVYLTKVRLDHPFSSRENVEILNEAFTAS